MERVPDGWERLFLTLLNLFACACHLVGGAIVTVLYVEGTPSVPCVAPLFEFLDGSDGGPFFAPRPRVMFEVGVLLGLTLFAFITAAAHLVYILLLYSASFQKFVQDWVGGGGVNPLRWLEFSVSSSIMAALGNLDVGITDFYYFLKTIATTFAIMLVGYILEILDHTDPLHKRVGSLLWTQTTLLNLVNVAAMLYQVFASKTNTDVFAYNVVPFAILFQTFGIVAWLNFTRRGFFRMGWYTEAWYIFLSLGTKVAVFWIGLATFRGISEDRGFAPRTEGVDWDVVRFVFSFVPIGLMALVAVFEYARFYRKCTITHAPARRRRQGYFYANSLQLSVEESD